MIRASVFVLALVMTTCAATSRAADTPTMSSPGSGEHRVVPGNRDLCWSEPVDLEAGKISSEIIGMYGLESEIANDFILESDAYVTLAIGYGGYYNWVPGDPEVTSYNWKFYTDAACVPDVLFDTYASPGTVTFVGYDGYGYPSYKIENAGLAVSVAANQIIWFVLQAADHPFPPQWGRDGARHVTNCDSMFRSEFFSYPEWTVAGDIGPFWEASQEFGCSTEPPVATKRSSWGAVRGLFR